MKYILTSLFCAALIFGALSANAQDATTTGSGKTGAAKYPFSIYKKITAAARLQNSARSAESDLIPVLVKGNVESIKAEIVSEGGIVKFTAGNIVSVRVPVSKIDLLASKSFVQRIEGSEGKLQVLNDQMILNTNVYLIQQGVGLPQAYDGSGVCIGIIDEGVDINHPDLRDEQGHTRIKWLWDQRLGFDPTYTPQPYGYGQRLTNTQLDNDLAATAVVDHDYSHGTLVAGVAAGNGLAVNNYHGVAPKADIVFVAVDESASANSNDIVDAVDYIFKRADSLHEPCAINISLGDYYGSHDGLDLQAQDIDQLLSAKSGRFIAAAAGNEGAAPIHLHTDVTPDSSFTWLGSADSTHVLYFQLWGNAADVQNVEWMAGADQITPSYSYQGGTNFTAMTSPFGYDSTSIYSGPNRLGLVETYVDSSMGSYSLTCQITPFRNNLQFRFMTRGTGKFDLWSPDMVQGNLPDPSSFPVITKYKLPDTDQTIVSSFTCSPKILTVGSCVNRDHFTDMNNELEYDTMPINGGVKSPPGSLSAFSSHGPTRDGRIKPDITSVGQWVISCAAAYDLNGPNGLYNLAPYAVAAGGMHKRGTGTSFASPVVAGAAALYLQKNPNASYQEIIDAIVNHAKTDQFTGSSLPNNYWGNGKLDAYRMINGSALGLAEHDIPANVYLENYPNPFADQTTIHYDLSYLNTQPGKAYITISDALGRKVRDIAVTGLDGDITFNRTTIAGGVYFYSLVLDGKIVRTNKLVVM